MVPTFGAGAGITVYKAFAHQDPSEGGFISSPHFIDEETETQKMFRHLPQATELRSQ